MSHSEWPFFCTTMTLLRIRADATSVWPYLLPYSLVVVGLYLMHFRGIGYWSIPIIVFIIIPLLDLVLGLDVCR